MNVTQAVKALVVAFPSALFVSSLGTATSALRGATNDGPHLYLGGSMGSALAVALGVAEKRSSRRVVAVLGDGEALMGAGSLWTLAGIKPANLLVAVLADGRYTITGGQALITSGNFADVARSLGIATSLAETRQEIDQAAKSLPCPALLELRCQSLDATGPSPFVDPPIVRWRFEDAASLPPPRD